MRYFLSLVVFGGCHYKVRQYHWIEGRSGEDLEKKKRRNMGDFFNRLHFPSPYLLLTSSQLWFGIWCFVVLSRLPYRQDKRMDELNLFIEHYSKYIVSIIWARHVLTLHLSHANWGKLKFSLYWQLQESSCTLCNFYQTESYQTFSSCNPLSMQYEETLILL